MMWAGQPVTHMRSANSKPQPSKTKSSPAHICSCFTQMIATSLLHTLTDIIFYDRTDFLIVLARLTKAYLSDLKRPG